MSPKKRTTDKHLPQRVYIKHKAYYYVDINNKWHFLGKAYPEAMATWVKLTSYNIKIKNMQQILDRYYKEVASLKSPKTYKDNGYAIANLRNFFGDMEVEDITPVHIYQYLDKRGKEGVRAANIEKALLSHIFTKAIEWGVVKDNPCRNVKSLPEKKRKRYVTDAEFLAVKKMASPTIAHAMDLAYLTGLRLGDIISVKISDLTEEGIKVVTNKTDAPLLMEWSSELKQCVENIKSLRKTIIGMYLLCTKRGQPYTADGFKSIWQRTIRKAFSEGLIEKRFRFHDIRRKAATDAEKLSGREYARQLLGHETQSMTANYISGEQRVKPLK